MIMVFRRPALAILALLSLSLPGPALAKDEKWRGVSEQVTIKAPKETVWKVIVDADKFEAKVKTAKENEAIVEQRFSTIPIFGTTTTTLKVTVMENQRLDYEMIKSDRLKALEGGWLLTPVDAGTTTLQLRSYVDPGLPFPRFIINHFVRGKVKHRLDKARTMAEKIYKQKRSAQLEAAGAVR